MNIITSRKKDEYFFFYECCNINNIKLTAVPYTHDIPVQTGSCILDLIY